MERIIHGGVYVDAIDKSLEWAVGFFLGNTELSLGLWKVIAGTQVVPSGGATGRVDGKA